MRRAAQSSLPVAARCSIRSPGRSRLAGDAAWLRQSFAGRTRGTPLQPCQACEGFRHGPAIRSGVHRLAGHTRGPLQAWRPFRGHPLPARRRTKSGRSAAFATVSDLECFRLPQTRGQARFEALDHSPVPDPAASHRSFVRLSLRRFLRPRHTTAPVDPLLAPRARHDWLSTRAVVRERSGGASKTVFPVEHLSDCAICHRHSRGIPSSRQPRDW